MAKHQLRALMGYSEQYAVPILIVTVPRVDGLYVNSLHPGTFATNNEMLSRPDLKLIDAIWGQYMPLIEQAGIHVDQRILMMGFSSPGMFSHRFALLHPDRVGAIWLGGEAPAPLPTGELDGHVLRYPLGTYDIEALTGKPFDWDAYRTIPHFICVGELDVNPNNDTTTYTDIFTENERLFIRAHFGNTNPERIQFFYEYLVSVGVPAEFRLYPNVGHELTDQMLRDAFEFLLENAS